MKPSGYFLPSATEFVTREHYLIWQVSPRRVRGSWEPLLTRAHLLPQTRKDDFSGTQSASLPGAAPAERGLMFADPILGGLCAPHHSNAEEIRKPRERQNVGETETPTLSIGVTYGGVDTSR